MANGFQPYLLIMLSQAFNGQNPARKITPPGYLSMLLNNGSPNVISTSKSDALGHVRDVKYTYRQPTKKGTSDTTDSCDIIAKPSRLEATIPSTLFRRDSVLFEDDVIAQYEQEASRIIRPNIQSDGTIKPLSPDNFRGILGEVYDVILDRMRGLIADINNDLLVAQAASFGVNAVTGNNSAVTINFTLSTATNPLTDGFTKLLSQARENEFNLSNAGIVGSGLIDNYMIQHIMGAKSTDQSGVNSAALTMANNYFFDIDAASAWGTNKFGVFDKGAVQFLEVDRYVGFKAGQLGSDYFFNAAFPLVDSLGKAIGSIKFDMQLRYSNCPQTIAIDGEPTAVGRGWNLIISKSFHQVNLPADLYTTGDRLAGNNGTLLFTATNS